MNAGRALTAAAFILLWPIAALSAVWATAAICFDFPLPGLRIPVAIFFLLLLLVSLIFLRGVWRKLLAFFVAFLVVLVWWRTIEPRNDRQWAVDVDRTASAEVNGDDVTLYNVRNLDYRSKTDYISNWETRKVRLSQLTGLDLAINYWGSDLMAHPIASFQFADAAPVCFSIEVRKERNEKDSLLGGLYRHFELVYIMADERDVLRLRTNYRLEDVYLYRTTATPEQARQRFLEYLSALNELHEKPKWYNAVTTNCTTTIRAQRSAADRAPWDWRILVNGKGDELLYERNSLSTGGLVFAALREKSLINETAKANDRSADFSKALRDGRPGFGGK